MPNNLFSRPRELLQSYAAAAPIAFLKTFTVMKTDKQTDRYVCVHYIDRTYSILVFLVKVVSGKQHIIYKLPLTPKKHPRR